MLRIRRFALLFMLLLSSSAFADSSARLSSGVDLIVTTLNSGADLPAMIKQIAVGIRAQGVCKENALAENETVADCMRGTDGNSWYGHLDDYLAFGVKNGKLDKIEAAVLRRDFTAIGIISGDTEDGVLLTDSPQMPVPGGHNVPEPDILTYRTNKAAFSALRQAKKMEAVLPADLVNQMAKTYPRKMNGVGNVTTEQYFAAQLNRLQLNELAGLMISATDFMTRPDAKMVFYPANYGLVSEQLQRLQSQEISLAEQIAAIPAGDGAAAQLAPLQSQLQSLELQKTALSKKDPVDELQAQRSALNEQLFTDVQTLAQSGIDDETRAKLAADMSSTTQQISSIDNQLAQLIRTEDIAPEDVQRFAMNALRQDLAGLTQQAPFSGLNIQVADVLLAAWVSGDISSDALRALDQISTFQETHESVWKKALSIGWTIGQGAMMAYPTTSYIAIAISVLLQVRSESKSIPKEQSDETHLIPAQP